MYHHSVAASCVVEHQSEMHCIAAAASGAAPSLVDVQLTWFGLHVRRAISGRPAHTRRSLFSGLTLKRSPVSRIYRRRHRCGMAVFRRPAAARLARLSSPTRASCRAAESSSSSSSGIQCSQLRGAARRHQSHSDSVLTRSRRTRRKDEHKSSLLQPPYTHRRLYAYCHLSYCHSVVTLEGCDAIKCLQWLALDHRYSYITHLD